MVGIHKLVAVRRRILHGAAPGCALLALWLVSIGTMAGQQHPPGTVRPPVYHYTGLAVIDTQIATVVGENGVIARTTDGGATWTRQASGPAAILADVAFTTSDTGVVVGERGTILRTTDGGGTWTAVPSPTGETLNAVCLSGGGKALAVGDQGVVLRSTDLGATWSLDSAPRSVALRDVACRPSRCVTEAR